MGSLSLGVFRNSGDVAPGHMVNGHSGDGSTGGLEHPGSLSQP